MTRGLVFLGGLGLPGRVKILRLASPAQVEKPCLADQTRRKKLAF